MDVQQIKQLVELMVENDLSRIELREGDLHLLLRRGQPIVAGAPAAHVPPLLAMSHAPAMPPPPALAASTAAPPAPSEATNETLIRSPMVGTFYAAADPNAPPFAKVGDAISPETVVCLIEAMKVFNEIKAETSGRITKVLVKNAQAVEFDQPLFAVAPH